MSHAASVAYSAYADAKGWTAQQGTPLSEWEDLPAQERQAWNAAIRAVCTDLLAACFPYDDQGFTLQEREF